MNIKELQIALLDDRIALEWKQPGDIVTLHFGQVEFQVFFQQLDSDQKMLVHNALSRRKPVLIHFVDAGQQRTVFIPMG